VFSFQSNEGGRAVTSVVVCESVLISIECVIFHCSTALCFLIGGEVDIALDSQDQKTRGFVVQIALPRWFPERTHQVFGEMPVRI
jgi:hypothetical protein